MIQWTQREPTEPGTYEFRPVGYTGEAVARAVRQDGSWGFSDSDSMMLYAASLDGACSLEWRPAGGDR